MKIVIMLLLLVGISTTLEGCGRRGQPVAPQLQQAQ